MKSIFAAVVLVLFVSPVVNAADEKDQPRNDTDFLIRALTASNCEIKLSEYAAKNASDEKVRDYANRMAKAHNELNKHLNDNAKRLKVAVVVGQEKETRAKLDKLGMAKGIDQDREYLQMMFDGHEKTIALFEAQSKNGTDANLKTVATDHLPALKKHRDEAKEHLTRLKK